MGNAVGSFLPGEREKLNAYIDSIRDAWKRAGCPMMQEFETPDGSHVAIVTVRADDNNVSVHFYRWCLTTGIE